MSRLFFRLALSLSLFTFATGAASGQRLATYDARSTGEELAGRRCPPGPAMMFTREVPHPPAAGLNWYLGAVASSNLTRHLYWCNGPAGDGIQRLPWWAVAQGGVPATTFPVPNVIQEVTGMVVDPTEPGGEVLWITDGDTILRYRLGTGGGVTGTVSGGPVPWPFAGQCGGSMMLTGLAYDPWNDVVVAVSDTGCLYEFDPATMTWTPPTYGVPNPPHAQVTGVQICLVTGEWFLSKFNGSVESQTYGPIPFPPAPGGGLRLHQGLTYLGEPVELGPPPAFAVFPRIVYPATAYAGNADFGLRIDPDGPGRLWLLLDTAAQANPLPTPAGTAYVDPATTTVIDLGEPSAPRLVSLPLPAAALGTQAVVQALAVRPDGTMQLSPATWNHVFLAY